MQRLALALLLVGCLAGCGAAVSPTVALVSYTTINNFHTSVNGSEVVTEADLATSKSATQQPDVSGLPGTP